MVGGLGIIIILIMIIRHIGACVKESSWNYSKRNTAMQNGKSSYLDANVQWRKTDSNHTCSIDRDPVFGLVETDLVTGEKIYKSIDDAVAEMRQENKNPFCWEDNIYRTYLKPMGGFVYINEDTEEVYRLVYIPSFRAPEPKEDVWFYTDVWTQTKVIRKTALQLKRDQELIEQNRKERTWSLAEIENYSYDGFENWCVPRQDNQWKLIQMNETEHQEYIKKNNRLFNMEVAL